MSAIEREYEPEIGQMAFGQPSQRYAADDLLDAALSFIRQRMDVVLWNHYQREKESPFGNTGSRFETDGLIVEAYSWNEDVEQPFNFKRGDVEVSWYKYAGRGMSINRQMTPDDTRGLLSAALAILDRVDDGLQEFTYV